MPEPRTLKETSRPLEQIVEECIAQWESVDPHPRTLIKHAKYALERAIIDCVCAYAEEREAALKEQIDSLAKEIMENQPNEPSRSEGAIECAIRLLCDLRAENEHLKAERTALLAVVNLVPDLLELANQAMQEANWDGAEWDTLAELTDIHRALAALPESVKEGR